MFLTAGVGFKPAHFKDAARHRAEGFWLEVHPENYMVDGGARLRMLEALRQQHPISLHGVSMSLAGPERPQGAHLERLAALVERIEPPIVSEHLAWSWLQGRYEPDLLPVVRDADTLKRVCGNIDEVQERIRRPIAIENPSHYLVLEGHAWDEVDFLHELVRRTGCKLLVDVANVNVSAHNLGQDARRWIDRIDGDAVAEIHIAGYTPDALLGDAMWIDSHAAPVADSTWQLLQRLVERIGCRPTLLERDGNLPDFPELLAERSRAHLLLTSMQRT